MMCVTSDRIETEEAIRENESFPKCTPNHPDRTDIRTYYVDVQRVIGYVAATRSPPSRHRTAKGHLKKYRPTYMGRIRSPPGEPCFFFPYFGVPNTSSLCTAFRFNAFRLARRRRIPRLGWVPGRLTVTGHNDFGRSA